MAGRELIAKNLPARFAIGAALSAFLAWIILMNWSGAVGHVSVSIVHWRIFSLSVMVFALVHVSVWALEPRWHELGSWPVWTSVVSFSVVFGLAIGTTDWQAWTISRWWQFWWTGGLAMGAAGQIPRIIAAQSHQNRSPSGQQKCETLTEFRTRSFQTNGYG